MSDAKARVREAAKSLGIEIAEDRLEQLATAWVEALEEAHFVRQHPNPWPTPKAFDAAWSEKR